jgi:hypothetical protein
MKKPSNLHLYAAPVLAAILIFCNSFKPDQIRHSKIKSAGWIHSTANLYTDGSRTFLVSDNGESSSPVADAISEPLAAECGDDAEPADFLTVDDVTSGNIR